MTSTLAENLRACRQAAGYTQTKLSRICGISRQSLHRHESGKIRPTEENLISYAKVLGVSALDLKAGVHPSVPLKFQVFDQLTWTSGKDI